MYTKVLITVVPTLLFHVVNPYYRFQSLTRDSDGEEYSAKMLLSARVYDFKLVVLTQLIALPKEFTEQFFVIRIHTSDLK